MLAGLEALTCTHGSYMLAPAPVSWLPQPACRWQPCACMHGIAVRIAAPLILQHFKVKCAWNTHVCLCSFSGAHASACSPTDASDIKHSCRGPGRCACTLSAVCPSAHIWRHWPGLVQMCTCWMCRPKGPEYTCPASCSSLSTVADGDHYNLPSYARPTACHSSCLHSGPPSA